MTSYSGKAQQAELEEDRSDTKGNPKMQSETYSMPVTPAQERFWSLDQLRPGNPALNMPLMWQCNGDLDVAILKKAYQACVDRHESLRTTFSVVEGHLREIVRESLSVDIPVVDLTEVPGDTRRKEANRLTREHAAYRFDLKNGPLIELKLLRLGAREHLLLVTMHHIICDGISNGILMRDLFEFYEAGLLNRDVKLPELPVQYADYALWHQEWRKSEEHARSLSFWRERLGEKFTTLEITHDTNAETELPQHLAGSTGAIETLLVPAEIVLRERAFCQIENVTQNVFFFASFLAWLSRITGERDLVVGYPVANRSEETQDVIGLFINIQPIRVQITEQTTFRDLLHHVERWTIESGEHQTLSYEDLVQHPEFADGKDALQVPIFFLYQPSFMQVHRITTPASTLQVIPLRSESPGAIFEMMLAVIDRLEEGPRLQLEYNPQLYKTSTIQRYLKMMVSVLDGACSGADTPVLQLPLLSAPERQAILNSHRGPEIDFGPFVPVHQTIIERARKHPQRIALENARQTISYGALIGRAMEIAQHLRSEGITPGDRVAVCMGRSSDTIPALLGILFAGGIYVPLDARYPRERIQVAISDSGSFALLTDRELNIVTDTKIIQISSIQQPVDPAFEPYTPAATDAAYVIYTSGSTGRPKGVSISHGSLRNLLLSVKRSPGLTEADVWVAITTISFDIAALEIFLPLMVGARITFATENEARTPSLLLSLIHDTSATVLQATPGAWRALIDEGWQGIQPLKVLCGGEALSRDLANRLLDRSHSVWNMYGPTETTIWSSATPVTRGDESPSIDQILPNQQFYVLDDNLQPLPPGMTGELCIAGSGVANGYWTLPDLTAQRFRPNPFREGTTIYRTGDSARIEPDGSIRLLGRTDFQVKVRGYRIELGEIENALEQHPSVREAIVMHHVLADSEGGAGVTRMVAYVDAPSHATDELAPALIQELEALVGRTLPEYMMPNVIVALPELPRLINGKVNRKELPDVFKEAGDRGVRISGSEGQAFQAPRDFLERQLTDIWQTTLGIPRISTQASFFSLAVGSLAAVRLVTKMNRIFAMEFGLASLISAPTIQDIAKLIRDQHDSAQNSTTVPIQPKGSKPPLFILHGVGGNIINFIGLSRRLDADRPVYAIQSQALLTGQSALLRIEDMAAFYISEIKKVQPEGPYHLLGYSFGGTVAAEIASQLTRAGEKVAYLSMLDARTLAFEEEFQNSMTVHRKIDRRVRRLIGNTNDLSWRNRVNYISGKLATRTVRMACRIVISLGFRRLPSWMKSAYDVNYVALHSYRLHAFPGRLILFRATEQDYASGPRDLGWKKYFPGGISIYEIPGDHERIFLEPAVDEMAKQISTTLREVSE